MQDKDEVQHQISILLFIGLACGVVMMALTRLYGSGVLTGNNKYFICKLKSNKSVNITKLTDR